MFRVNHQAGRREAEYWYQRRKIKKAGSDRKMSGNPVASGGFKPDYIPSYKMQRMKERYRDNLKGAKR